MFRRAKAMEGMSEREKRARAAEIRFLQMQNKLELCAFCRVPLTMIPFERLSFRYCSTKCVAEHKKQLEAST